MAMPSLDFKRNEYPTIGVELELQLVDAETLALSNSISEVLEGLPEEINARVKPELMQSYLEINTGICRTVSEVQTDLSATLDQVAMKADTLGLKLFWAATHPFSSWRDQKITVNDRYYRLVELMQDVGSEIGDIRSTRACRRGYG